jgi:hypothetical protein
MIKSVEDAKKYIDEVTKKMGELIALSEEAGLPSHILIWCACAAAFSLDIAEVERIKEIMGQYLDELGKRRGYDDEFVIPSPGTNTIK